MKNIQKKYMFNECLYSDKTRFKFQLVFSQLIKSYFGKLFRQRRDISEMFLKPFKKLVVRVLSHLKHSATRRVLYVIKHSYSFIKHYLKHQHIIGKHKRVMLKHRRII